MGALVGFVVVLAVLALASGGVVWRLRRRNRVVPAVRTRAPLSWLVSPRRAAFAHRRLRRAVSGARAAAGAARASDDLAYCLAELERHATAIDDHLVLAARCSPTVRRSLLQGLAGEVAQLERLAARVAYSAMSSPTRDLRGEGRDTSTRISERLDALDAARAELAALEAAWATPSYHPLESPPH